MAEAVSTKNSSNGNATAISSRRLTDGGPRIIGGYLRSTRPARQTQAVAAAAQGFDRLDDLVGVELAAQAADQHLDHITVAIEILFVQPFGELTLGDHLTGAQHQVLENAVFETRQLHRRAAYAHRLGACVEFKRPAGEPGAGPTTGTPQQR